MNRIILFVISILMLPCFLNAKEIKICVDENFWYPFTYEENGLSKGIHIDVVAHAMRNLGHTPHFHPQPWKRCLHNGKAGNVDAVVSASYKPDRANFLFYPPDASTAKKSKWRITQVEYIVVSYIKDPYEFNGDIISLPRPVRAPLGYSIVDDLKNEGIEVEKAFSSKSNIAKLIRDKKGVVITLPMVAEILSKKYPNKLKMHPAPIKSKSYFIVFSKKCCMTKKERMEVWNEIVRLRNNQEFMSSIYGKY